VGQGWLILTPTGSPEPQNRNIIEIAGELRHSTEKAHLFLNGSKEVWIVKAVCEWSEEEKLMQMEEWLALEKGLI